MTAQINDRIEFEGRTRRLASEPLAYWLHRRLNRKMRFLRQSTALSRGYRSTWQVARGRLYLTEFDARLPDGTPATMDMLFQNYSPQFYESVHANHPSNAGPGRFAFWVSAVLYCPFGKTLEYHHSGYDSVTEGELVLWFREGFLIGSRIIHRSRIDSRECLDMEADIEADLDLDD